jgi:hypothetical protein
MQQHLENTLQPVIDMANVLTEMRAQILNERTKILLLINGGGAVALTTLFQAIL